MYIRLLVPFATRYFSAAYKLACLALLIVLSGCGFHLRGEARLPAEMKHVYIESIDPAGPLKNNLEKALIRSGATIEDKINNDVAVLKILVSTLKTDVLSVGTTARAKEYVMRYHVEFEVQTTAGNTLISRQTIELSRDFTFDETQALGAAAEQDMLRQELERDMVQAILRRLETRTHTP